MIKSSGIAVDAMLLAKRRVAAACSMTMDHRDLDSSEVSVAVGTTHPDEMLAHPILKFSAWLHSVVKLN